MNLFDFHIPDFVFVIISMIFLTFVLTKLLWKPLNKVLDERQAKIARGIADAEEAALEKQGLSSLRAKFEADMEQDTVSQMKDARVRAGHEYDRIVADAESKAHAILDAAKTQAEQDHDNMLSAAQREIIASALAAASALLKENMDSERNTRLIESFLQGEGVTK